MVLDRLPDLYYTAEQARMRLGMTKDAFQHYVKTGLIKRTNVVGRYGHYSKRDIDYMAMAITAALLAAQTSNITFQQATKETLEKELELAVLCFGEQTKNFHDLRRAFFERNPAMFYHVLDHDHLASSINIVPLRHEAIPMFLEGERGWHLGEYIDDFTPGKSHELIIIDMMSTPLVPMNRRTQYAMHLFTGLSRTLESWGRQGVEIFSVHANGGTLEGIRLLETAGFTRVADHGKRLIYELFVENSDLRILEPYKKAYAQWQAQQGEVV